MVDVRLPNGTVVGALALRERKEEDPDRDHGLYFDVAWRPKWNADIADWEDMGLPRDHEATAHLIQQAFARAKQGELVELGCIGGLGRTGTALACMAVLAGVPASEAVGWVRRNYDPRAIETADQEQWVEWFAASFRRGNTPAPL
jgi:hypothetical protein